jgi:hypothetical protein
MVFTSHLLIRILLFKEIAILLRIEKTGLFGFLWANNGIQIS